MFCFLFKYMSINTSVLEIILKSNIFHIGNEIKYLVLKLIRPVFPKFNDF